MSKELAELALQNSDQNQAKKLLEMHKLEIDRAFFAYLFEIAGQHSKDRNYKLALADLRLIFIAGQIVGESYYLARALCGAAEVEIEIKAFDKSVDTLNRCIIQCDKSPDSRSSEVKARAYHLLAWVQYQQFSQQSEALENFKVAATIYEKLQKYEDARKLQSFIEKIKSDPSFHGNKSLGDIVDDIVKSKDRSSELQNLIDNKKTQLTGLAEEARQLSSQVETLSVQVNDLNGEKATLVRTCENLRQQEADLHARLELRTRALDVPLWVAAVRADISEGMMSDITLTLLDKLRLKAPEYADPLIVEIGARNGISPISPIDTTGFTFEQELFAGISKAATVESENPLEAISLLLNAWETYLKNLNGVNQ